MTTIVGIQGSNYSIVCTDSRVSSFDEGGMAYQITTLGTGSSKVAESGRYLLGAAGDVRAINILHHVFVPPVPNFTTTGPKLDHFITQRFIPILRDCFESCGYATPDNDTKEHKNTLSQIISHFFFTLNLYLIQILCQIHKKIRGNHKIIQNYLKNRPFIHFFAKQK